MEGSGQGMDTGWHEVPVDGDKKGTGYFFVLRNCNGINKCIRRRSGVACDGRKAACPLFLCSAF